MTVLPISSFDAHRRRAHLNPEGLTFAENDEYLRRAASGKPGAVLAKQGADTFGIPAIRVEQPRRAFGQFLHMCDRPLPLEPGRSIRPQW